MPAASLIGLLINPKNPDSVDEAKDMQDAAAALSLQALVLNASDENGIDAAFARDFGEIGAVDDALSVDDALAWQAGWAVASPQQLHHRLREAAYRDAAEFLAVPKL